MNKKKIICLSVGIIIIIISIIIFFVMNHDEKEEIIEYQPFSNAKYTKLNNYEDYSSYMTKNTYSNIQLDESKFDVYKYVLVLYNIDTCSEEKKDKRYEIKDNTLNIYIDFSLKCGGCSLSEETEIFKIPKDENYDDIKVYQKAISTQECDANVAYKPMIYIYPEEEMDLTIKLGNSSLLTHTYPKYKNKWNIHVDKNSNIYDYNTKRNYYGLYWEAIDNTKIDMNKGFIIKGDETVEFLEDKLSILGLNDREINEFIVYWIDKLEDNNYNYISFRTTKEVNEYMPLTFSKNPDTLIRIIMDFKPLNKKINVEEQQLTKVKRKGFTVIEWGGVKH